MSKNSPELIRLRSLSEKDVINLYQDQKLSHKQISELFKVSRTAVQNIFKKYRLRGRSNAESQRAINEGRFQINPEQEQLILGGLLGDSCLSHQSFNSNKTGKRLESYKVCFYHSAKYLEYVLYKRKIIGQGVKIKKPLKLSYRTSGHGAQMVGFSFCHTPTLKKLAPICLGKWGQKRLSKEWLNRLKWAAVAYWYQDDGSLSISKNGHRTIRFHTQGFSLKEIKLLKKMLHDFELVHTTHTRANKKENQFTINAHRKNELDKFFKGIKPYLCPCMEYKTRIKGLVRPMKPRVICQK